MKNTKQLKEKMLNDEQVTTVKEMIVSSMRDVYTNNGDLPDIGFEEAAYQIADRIIKNTQMALLQGEVFDKAIEKSSPIKKPVKKVTKKSKKHGKSSN